MKKSAGNFECGNCGQPEPNKGDFNVCGRCSRVRYCDRACQAAHWKKGGHKTACLKPEACKPNPAEERPAGDTCIICLDSLSASRVGTLKCGHNLHVDCMAALDKCPICRRPHGDCALCFKPITSDVFGIDDRCEHKMHRACFGEFHFQGFRGAILDAICPIDGCDAAVRPDAPEFRAFRVKSMMEMCAAKEKDSDKFLIWLFKNTFNGDKTSREDRIKCKVYCFRALCGASNNAVRSEAEVGLGLLQTDKAAAVAAYQRALQWHPGNVGAMVALLECGELDAYDMFKLVEAQPTNLGVLRAVANELHANYYVGTADQPIVDFTESVLRRILFLDPLDGKAYARLGTLLMSTERNWVEAEIVLRAAIALKKPGDHWDFCDLHMDLAHVLVERGDFAGAQDSFIYALEHDEEDPEMALNFCINYPGEIDMQRMESVFREYADYYYAEFLFKVKKDRPAAEAYIRECEPIADKYHSVSFEEAHDKGNQELIDLLKTSLEHPVYQLPEGVWSLALTPLAPELELLD